MENETKNLTDTLGIQYVTLDDGNVVSTVNERLKYLQRAPADYEIQVESNFIPECGQWHATATLLLTEDKTIKDKGRNFADPGRVYDRRIFIASATKSVKIAGESACSWAETRAVGAVCALAGIGTELGIMASKEEMSDLTIIPFTKILKSQTGVNEALKTISKK